jgi:hypothetical protein
MMLIKDWLEDFLIELWLARIGRQWPGPDSTEGRMTWSAWLRVLIDLKADRQETELAVSRIAAEITDPEDVLPAIVQEIKILRREPVRGNATADRKSAEAASRDCLHCGGTGWAMVPDRRCGEAAAHCVCPLGRWMRSKTNPKFLLGIVDFAALQR